MSHPVIPLRELVEAAKKLPCAPALLPKLLKLLDDPDATSDQIESLIKLDSGLAAAMLRLANSAYFNNSTPCDSFNDAIVRLGFREIYRLATTKIASGWLMLPAKGYGWEVGDLYRHSLTVAVGADLLARETSSEVPELAYTAGLLHDVGKLALAFVCTDNFDDVRELQAREKCAWRVAENRLLGYDHSDVGGALLQAWSFPDNLIQVVKYVCRPGLADAEYRGLVTHVHAAKHMALCLGTGVGEDGYHTEIDEDLMAEHGITPEMLEHLLPAVLEGSMRLLAGEAKV
jgi:putative nucleotidyltransferase with HDIG domain